MEVYQPTHLCDYGRAMERHVAPLQVLFRPLFLSPLPLSPLFLPLSPLSPHPSISISYSSETCAQAKPSPSPPTPPALTPTTPRSNPSSAPPPSRAPTVRAGIRPRRGWLRTSTLRPFLSSPIPCSLAPPLFSVDHSRTIPSRSLPPFSHPCPLTSTFPKTPNQLSFFRLTNTSKQLVRHRRRLSEIVFEDRVERLRRRRLRRDDCQRERTHIYRPRGGRGADEFAHTGDGGRGGEGRVGGGDVAEWGVESGWELVGKA